ncbi:MAG: hypothetical protein KGL67_02260 [Patescibacteria group bacterium]|nr:hypothetical protein [Patescibacteria group bacterium]
MQKRNVLNSPRLSELKKKKQKIFVRKVVIFGILLLIIIGILSYVSRIKRLNISAVEVQGNKVIDTEAVMAAVNKETSGYYFWLFPKTNLFLYPKSKIKSDLANQFKRFQNITIDTQNNKTLAISVTERIPEYTWCGATPPATGNDKETCYFLDKDGYIFDQAPYFSGGVYFKFYGKTDQANGLPIASDNPSGSYVAKGYFDKLISFKDTLASISLKPSMLYIEDTGDIDVFLSKVKVSSATPKIVFKQTSDFQKIAENFRAALGTEPLQSKFKNQYSALEYIDLRFDNKVYYKFTTDSPATPPTSKAAKKN